VQALVFEQRLNDQLARVPEFDNARKQPLLFFAEVPDSLVCEEKNDVAEAADSEVSAARWRRRASTSAWWWS
jgi:hypothetical protein